MSVDAPHILLLDEPTNHLDIVSREALVRSINSFEGAVVIVSHDPHLIALTADRFWLVADGRVTPFDGDMDDYRTLMAGRGASGEKTSKSQNGQRGGSKKERRREGAEKRQARKALKSELKSAESAIEKLEAKKEELNDAIADPALYQDKGDSAKLVALQKQLGQVVKDLIAAEDRWTKVQETLDAADA